MYLLGITNQLNRKPALDHGSGAGVPAPPFSADTSFFCFVHRIPMLQALSLISYNYRDTCSHLTHLPFSDHCYNNIYSMVCWRVPATCLTQWLWRISKLIFIILVIKDEYDGTYMYVFLFIYLLIYFIGTVDIIGDKCGIYNPNYSRVAVVNIEKALIVAG